MTVFTTMGSFPGHLGTQTSFQYPPSPDGAITQDILGTSYSWGEGESPETEGKCYYMVVDKETGRKESNVV